MFYTWPRNVTTRIIVLPSQRSYRSGLLNCLRNEAVLDPFTGSGTTNFVAQRMKRNSIGIEIMEEYYDMVKEKIEPVKLVLFDPKQKYAKTKLSVCRVIRPDSYFAAEGRI